VRRNEAVAELNPYLDSIWGVDETYSPVRFAFQANHADDPVPTTATTRATMFSVPLSEASAGQQPASLKATCVTATEVAGGPVAADPLGKSSLAAQLYLAPAGKTPLRMAWPS